MCIRGGDEGKLLGVFIGPGAEPRQWSAVCEELLGRSRFLASLGLAWSGALPLFRSHVLPVAGHLAQMCPVSKHLLRTEARRIPTVLKPPFQAIPVSLLRIGRSFCPCYDMPELETMRKAAASRAA